MLKLHALEDFLRDLATKTKVSWLNAKSLTEKLNRMEEQLAACQMNLDSAVLYDLHAKDHERHAGDEPTAATTSSANGPKKHQGTNEAFFAAEGEGHVAVLTGMLEIKVIEASGLRSADRGQNDPFVELMFMNEKYVSHSPCPFAWD